MFPVFLTKTKTRDGVTLEGIAILPKQKSDTALVWLHGLSSRFSSGQTLTKELSAACQKSGIGYFKFNNRGHDIVNCDLPEKFGGAGFEKFEDCVLDIRAMLNFAGKSGYKKIILAGHSTGANKALYYLYKTRDRRIKKLILLGPISDIAAETKRIGGKKLHQGVRIAQKLKNKKPNALMPQEFGIYTARRYLGLYLPGSSEDVFPYHNPRARWKELKSVYRPLAVIIGSHDEHLDQSAGKLVEIFRKNVVSAENFSGIIIKRAGHGFRKKEKEISKEIIKFIRRVVV